MKVKKNSKNLEYIFWEIPNFSPYPSSNNTYNSKVQLPKTVELCFALLQMEGTEHQADLGFQTMGPGCWAVGTPVCAQEEEDDVGPVCPVVMNS